MISTSIGNDIAKKPHVLMLVFLISFGTVCAVLFTPALPSISDFFGVSNAAAQLAVSLYLIGYALGQLPYGPIANRFGRLPALKFGIVLQLLGTALCIASYHAELFWLLLIGRFIMALGASVGLMMAYTLLNDFYEQSAARTIASKMMMAFAILPGVSLFLGGFLCEIFSWQSCFYFLFAYGISIFCLVTLFLEEPVFPRIKRLELKNIADGLLVVSRNQRVISYAMLMGGCTAIIYMYSAASPFICMDVLQMDEAQFGMLSVIPPLGILLGSWCANKLNQKYAANIVIKYGIFFGLLSATMMLVGFYMHMNIISLLLPMMLINASLTLVMANASVLSSSSCEDKASAASMMNFINMTVGAVGVALLQLFPQVWLGLLPLSILAVLFFMAVVLKIINRFQK